MPKCQCCGKEVLLPFECPYCSKAFCTEHRLPENHQCTHLPEKPFWYQKQKATKKEANKERFKEEGELYFTKEASPTEEEPKRAARQKTHESKKKLILVFFVLLVVVSAIVAYVSYNLGYSISYDVAYNASYDLAHREGYDAGYVDGNETGYQVGYELGYDYGNSSGYEIGFDMGYNLGNQSGYDLGYLLGFHDGNETGYDGGYIQGVEDGAGRGYTIRDPTYQEAIQFITSDQTNKNEYNEENYTCANFAADFKNNAFTIGYRCGYVTVEFPDFAHAMVCFNTIDKGLIFIDPQDDQILTLTIGQPYWDRTIYESPDYDDTIVRFFIVW